MAKEIENIIFCHNEKEPPYGGSFLYLLIVLDLF